MVSIFDTSCISFENWRGGYMRVRNCPIPNFKATYNERDNPVCLLGVTASALSD